MTVTLMSPCKLLSTCRKQAKERGEKRKHGTFIALMTEGITTKFIVWCPRWPTLLYCAAISVRLTPGKIQIERKKRWKMELKWH